MPAGIHIVIELHRHVGAFQRSRRGDYHKRAAPAQRAAQRQMQTLAGWHFNGVQKATESRAQKVILQSLRVDQTVLARVGNEYVVAEYPICNCTHEVHSSSKI